MLDDTHDELRQANEELKARLLERTAELASVNAVLAGSNVELRRLQRASRETDARLALALSAAHLSWWDCDFRNGIVYLSDEWSVMLGGERKPTRTTMAELFDVVHPDDRERLQATFIAVLKGHRSEYRIEHRVSHKSGEWRWIDSRGEVVERDATGRALRGTGINADITARVATEEALRESEALLRAFTDEISMMVAMIDREERYTFVNQTFEQWYGVKREDVLGKTTREILGETEYGRIQNSLALAMSGKPTTFRRRSRIGRELFARYFPHRDSEGRVIGIYALVEDVTPRARG
jgi:two-component system sensor histidine kinase/response regulator